MRISSSGIYRHAVNAMQGQQATISKLQEQLSTGYRVRTPSDDPIAAAQIELMDQRISFTENLQHNVVAARGKLELEEKVISGSVSALQQLREIQVRAGDGSLSDSDRKTLAQEAASLLNQLQGDANSKDAEGFYLFSGGRASTAAVSVNAFNQYVYNGDSTQRFQAITHSSQVAINDTGDALFMSIPNGNGRFSISETASPNTGTAVLSSGVVSNASAFVADNYTLSFALNTQGELVYLVNGSASGSVIPPTGLPDDAPLYKEGGTVNFNGIEISVTGIPEAGDAFSIQPSHNTSLFTTIQNMISNLNKPKTTATEKASVLTENNQLLEELDSALNHVLNFQSDIGNRLNQLERAETSNIDLITTSKDTLKTLREIDPTEVAVEFNLQLINLQAAQKSYVSIMGMSIFNYI